MEEDAKHVATKAKANGKRKAQGWRAKVVCWNCDGIGRPSALAHTEDEDSEDEELDTPG